MTWHTVVHALIILAVLITGAIFGERLSIWMDKRLEAALTQEAIHEFLEKRHRP